MVSAALKAAVRAQAYLSFRACASKNFFIALKNLRLRFQKNPRIPPHLKHLENRRERLWKSLIWC
jgi:hypothetical protein